MARLPDFLKNISPVGETLTAIDGGVAELSQAADAQNARLSVQTADEAGLALWERDYGLSSAGSLAERRARILTALSGGQTVTPAYLRGLCVSVGGADRGEVAEDFANWTAEVTAVSENRLPGDTGALESALTRLMPAHLQWSVVPCGEMTAEGTLYAAPFGAVYVEITA